MHKVLIALVIGVSCQASFAASGVTYLSCPSLDKRADDLLVIVDQPSGTASLQSNKSGSGLNFTSPASFGPKEVIWRSESKNLQQKFSVDRVNLILKRETTSGLTGSIYVETSPCSIVKAPSNTKF